MTMLGRKFSPEKAKTGGEVTIYQRERDVASELLDFCTHLIEKTSRDRPDLAFVNTPTIPRLMLHGIPGMEERHRLGWKTFEFRTYERAVLAPDIDLLALLEFQPRGKDGKPLAYDGRLQALRERILTIKGKLDRGAPLTQEQLIRLVIAFHLDQTKNGYRRYFELIEDEWLRAGIRTDNGVYEMTKDLGIKSHRDHPDDWCAWCLDHRDLPAPVLPRGRAIS